MKSLSISLVLICFFAFAKAQQTQPTISVDTLEFTLGIGEHQKINNIEITFLEVLEDSRCPKNVDCVWAGQAKIKVLIKEKGVTPVEKELIFDVSGRDVLIHASETTVIQAIRLSPYPKTSTAVGNRVYYLEIRA